MTSQTPKNGGTWIKRAASVAKTLGPAAIVFVAFDLAVSPDVSILRSTDPSSGDLEIVSLERLHDGLPAVDLAGETADSDHIWFGVEETVAQLSAETSVQLSHVGGGWSGQFASMLAGDVDTECWSPYEVNIRLKQEGVRIYGPGSYVVDPAECSGQSQPVVAFFNASGERHGDHVSLVLADDASDEITMLFNGVVTGDHIVGTFSMPNGAPASGTTVLTLLDPAS